MYRQYREQVLTGVAILCFVLVFVLIFGYKLWGG